MKHCCVRCLWFIEMKWFFFLKGETAKTREGQSHAAAHWRVQKGAGWVEAHGAGEGRGREQTHHGVCEAAAADGGEQKESDEGTGRSQETHRKNGSKIAFLPVDLINVHSFKKENSFTCGSTLISSFVRRWRRRGNSVRRWNASVRSFT